MRCFLSMVIGALIIAGCSAKQQGQIPAPAGAQETNAASRSAGHLILRAGSVKPDAQCPSGYVYCVTLAEGKPATLYFCYSTASYCGPSQYQYSWQSLFIVRKSGSINDYFSGAFSPNPGDPTYDTISEVKKLRSTQGRYKYAQKVCPVVGSLCSVHFFVGIAIE